MKSAAKRKPPTEFPSLELRIQSLHSELEDLIAARVAEIVRQCPGVHPGTIRQRIENRAHGCKCAVAKLISEGKA